MTSPYEQFIKAQIRLRLEFIKRMMELNIAEVEQWNHDCRDGLLLDCEIERVVMQRVRLALAALDAGDWDELHCLNHQVQEILDASIASKRSGGFRLA